MDRINYISRGNEGYKLRKNTVSTNSFLTFFFGKQIGKNASLL